MLQDVLEHSGPEAILYTVQNDQLSPFEAEQILFDTPYVTQHVAINKVPVFSIGRRSVIRNPQFKPGAKRDNSRQASARRTYQAPLGARAAMSMALEAQNYSSASLLNQSLDSATSAMTGTTPAAVQRPPRSDLPGASARGTMAIGRGVSGSAINSTGESVTDEEVIVADFILPTGQKITLPCTPKSSIETIKQILWQRLKKEERKSRTLRYYLKVTGTSYFVPEGDTPLYDTLCFSLVLSGTLWYSVLLSDTRYC
jgi:hypothetical protein